MHMRGIRSIRRFLPATLAFVFVFIGSWILLPRSTATPESTDTVGVVVLTRPMPKGSSAEDVRRASSVKQLPIDLVIDGAYDSFDDISTGVLLFDHAARQQIADQSFAPNRVAAVGPDFVVTSVRLSPQTWTGAVRISGSTVDIYALEDTRANLIAPGSVILDSPPIDDVQPSDDAVITLAVRRETLSSVLLAASEERLWLVGR